MPWIESASPSFRARHDSADTDDAIRVLHSLERTRAHLSEYFPVAVDDLVVVLHRSTLSLTVANRRSR